MRIHRSIVLAGIALAALLASAAPTPAAAQARPLAIPYQFTHSINDSLEFAPDGKRYVWIMPSCTRPCFARALHCALSARGPNP